MEEFRNKTGLPAAVRAILEGRKFVSDRLKAS